jgi:hypothetical protein
MGRERKERSDNDGKGRKEHYPTIFVFIRFWK